MTLSFIKICRRFCQKGRGSGDGEAIEWQNCWIRDSPDQPALREFWIVRAVTHLYLKNGVGIIGNVGLPARVVDDDLGWEPIKLEGIEATLLKRKF